MDIANQCVDRCWGDPYFFVGVYRVVVEDFGSQLAKKFSLIILFGVFFLLGVYVTIGFYQAFFIERREKFIARKVQRWSTKKGSWSSLTAEIWDNRYEVRGYYFKWASFAERDVATVEEYRVIPLNERLISKNIATLLSCPQPNYKVTLKDGREFYLPGEMERVNELKILLEADTRTAFSP